MIGKIFSEKGWVRGSKRMVASGFHQIEEPKPEEWFLIEPYIFKGSLSRYFAAAIWSHEGWFKLLDKLRVFETWLSSSDLQLVNAATEYLGAQNLHDNCSSRIAQLIKPFVNSNTEWQMRVKRIMSWKAHKSSEMADIHFNLLRQGSYDE
jgi:hypothetical protein